MKRLMLVFLLMFFSVESYAQDAQSLFKEANDFYRQGNYESAEKNYLAILEKGLENGPVYYNLGNVYFKLNNKGKAILYYEKAKRFIPRDSDLVSNLTFLNTLITDKTDPVRRPLFERLYFRVLEKFTLKEMAICFSFLFVGLMFFLIGSLFLRGTQFYIKWIAIALGCLILISGFFLGGKVIRYLFHKEAVIVVPEAKVYYAPNAEENPAFIIHSGLKILVTKDEDDWSLIRIDKDKAGWVQTSKFKLI